MSKIRIRQLILCSWLLLWLLLVATALQEFMREGGQAYWQPVLWESSSLLSAALLISMQRHFGRKFDYLHSTPWRWFAVQFAWLPVNCSLFVPLNFGMRHAVYALMGQTYHHQAWLQLFFYEAIKVSLLFAMCNVIVFTFLSWQQLLQEKDKAQAAHEALRLAQLQQLAQQMQPHFLFNALNTISSLMYSDLDKADAILIQLADVLRNTLEMGTEQQVPLEKELRLLRGYAALMSARFIDRVDIAWHIEPTTLPCLVPVMSLQPLLENIFKHTVEKTRSLTRIQIQIHKIGTELHLVFADDQGFLAETPASTGIGLTNLRSRLQGLYGSQARLELQQLTPRGVRTELVLPFLATSAAN
ncbi:MAG: histidine kinase [Burkholderiales bacterium]|nr:histidine kinase [Burkholderiales bacterium]